MLSNNYKGDNVFFFFSKTFHTRYSRSQIHFQIVNHRQTTAKQSIKCTVPWPDVFELAPSVDQCNIKHTLILLLHREPHYIPIG